MPREARLGLSARREIQEKVKPMLTGDGPPPGRRFAIFFAGMPDPCHLNTMEFGYRTLLNLGFDRANIIVACFEGAPLSCPEWRREGGAAGAHTWPGDNSPYRMPVHQYGNRYGFRAAVADLRRKGIGSRDLLFIHTSGHGSGDSWHGVAGTFLGTVDGKYYVHEFCEDLGELPAVRGLVVHMQQCCAGGFMDAVLRTANADSIAFSAPAPWNAPSSNDRGPGPHYTWNAFSRDWFAALAGVYYDGRAVERGTYLPAASGNGRISVADAHIYAASCPLRHRNDSPVAGYKGSGKQLALDGS